MRKLGWIVVLLLGPVSAQDLDRAVEVLDVTGPVPLVTQAVPGDWRLEKAYEVQRRRYQQRFGEALPLGFKAGLTTVGSQARFDVVEPVAGLLPPHAALPPKAGRWHLALEDFHAGMMEVELGFRFAKPVTQRIDDPLQLKALVAEVLPVVELPVLDFQSGSALTGIDLIAANVAAHRVLLGPSRAPAAMDINALPARLIHNGNALIDAKATDALGDQWLALQWLVNHLLAQGWTIQPDQVLITGALGPMLPLKPGSYRAEFGELGLLEFEVR